MDALVRSGGWRRAGALTAIAALIAAWPLRSARAADTCGSWLVYPGIAAGGAVVGALASASLIELLNEERVFPFLPAVLLSAGGTIGLVATYAGLTKECDLAAGRNGWSGAVPVTSVVVAAAAPIFVWYLSPIRRGPSQPEPVAIAVLPIGLGVVGVMAIRF